MESIHARDCLRVWRFFRCGEAMTEVIKLADIEMDTTIQCRASIDTATVGEYAERMTASDRFPPVELFRNGSARCYIGDGWHRIMAVGQIGGLTIEASIRAGGRSEALQYALGANKSHGHKRSNADKRRCVEIALREFSDKSSRVIADMCGVSHDTVASFRQLSDSDNTSKTTGKDGKQYKTHKKASGHPKPKKSKKAKALLRQLDAAESRGASLILIYVRAAITAIEAQTEFDEQERDALRALRNALATISL